MLQAVPFTSESAQRAPQPFARAGTEPSATLRKQRDAAVQILALAHRLRRAALTAQRGRLIAAKATVVAPARAARVAWRAVREYGDVTTADAGVSRFRQFAALWWLDLRYNYAPRDAYRFRLFTPDRILPRPLFLQWEEAALLYRTVNLRTDRTLAETLADKRRFEQWCAGQQLPTAPILMEFDGGEVTRNCVTGDEPPRTDLFAKWGTQYGGDFTQLWSWDNEHGYLDDQGKAWTFADIVGSLAGRSRDGVVLLQPRLVNHASLRSLSANALSTIRVMTIQRPGQSPRFLAGVLRMGTGNATADNFAQGGIASPVDAETGIIGPARRVDKQHRTQVYDAHPDTGVSFSGYRVPFWKESVELALDAHGRLGNIACVGWDVAVLEDGPVLIEGNWNPCTKLLQIATQVPLLTTEFADTYAAWLNEPECAVEDQWLVDQMRWQPV